MTSLSCVKRFSLCGAFKIRMTKSSRRGMTHLERSVEYECSQLSHKDAFKTITFKAHTLTLRTTHKDTRTHAHTHERTHARCTQHICKYIYKTHMLTVLEYIIPKYEWCSVCQISMTRSFCKCSTHIMQ